MNPFTPHTSDQPWLTQLGSRFVFGFRGSRVPEWLKNFTTSHGLGGVILFDYDCTTKTYENNIRSKSQLKELCSEIHSLRTPHGTAPLIFVDQEGGKVRRLKEKLGFSPLPSAQSYALLPVKERKQILLDSFREMVDLGIDCNLGPVVDLNINPNNPDIGAVERSFSADPLLVKTCAEEWFEAANETGLLLCLKHFPGLGGAKTNSHEEKTDVSDSILESQLQLFKHLLPKTPGHMVLVSHGLVRQWDPENPCSLSPTILGRFRDPSSDEIWVTDDLQMAGAVGEQGTRTDAPTQNTKARREQIALQAFRAGNDFLIFGNNLIAEEEQVTRYLKIISTYLEQEWNSEERKVSKDFANTLVSIRKSAERIQSLQRNRGLKQKG